MMKLKIRTIAGVKRNIFTDIHYCGDGFKGRYVQSKGLKFCGFCGTERRL